MINARVSPPCVTSSKCYSPATIISSSSSSQSLLSLFKNWNILFKLMRLLFFVSCSLITYQAYLSLDQWILLPYHNLIIFITTTSRIIARQACGVHLRSCGHWRLFVERYSGCRGNRWCRGHNATPGDIEGWSDIQHHQTIRKITANHL